MSTYRIVVMFNDVSMFKVKNVTATVAEERGIRMLEGPSLSMLISLIKEVLEDYNTPDIQPFKVNLWKIHYNKKIFVHHSDTAKSKHRNINNR